MINHRNLLGQSLLNKEDIVKQRVESKFPKFEYVGGYTGSDGYLYLMCKDCGMIKKHNAQITKPSRKTVLNCTNCASVINRVNKAKSIKDNYFKSRNKVFVQTQKIYDKGYTQQELKICPVCGNMFGLLYSKQIACSDKCSKKIFNQIGKDKRIRKIKRVLIDRDITLETLYKRDKGICQICHRMCELPKGLGGLADTNGNYYPSIDHIIPLAHGGYHSWSNVQLAHRQCNSRKHSALPVTSVI